jgi:nucleotide-binding universal stress UspA family protein
MAIELARQNNWEIKFITVVKVTEITRFGEEGIGYVFDYSKTNEELIKQQTKILDAAIDKYYSSSVPFEKKVLIGEPYEQILKYSDEENCDFIIMGRRGLSKIKRFFIGSVTLKVISNAKCPVLTINETTK